MPNATLNVDERYAFIRGNPEAVRLYERIGRFDWADATRDLAGWRACSVREWERDLQRGPRIRAEA